MQPDPLTYRQSRLRSYVQCARRTVLETGETAGNVGSAADLGSAFHAIAAEILRTLQRPDTENRIPHEEAVAISREVLDAGPWILAPDDDEWLRQMVLSFIDHPWQPSRFMAVEERLSVQLACPDGVLREITGQPDLVIADPPRGAVLVDHKTGMGKPREPREPPPEGQPITGRAYLYEGGFFQLCLYGMLIFHRWPRVQRVTIQEQSWRWMGPPRVETIERGLLEHLEPYFARLAMQLDKGLSGDKEFRKPRSGAWCARKCPVSRSCPIPAEQRGAGALGDLDTASSEAERWALFGMLRKSFRDALVAYHEQTGEFIPVHDGLLGWHANGDGKRKFEVRAT